MKTEIKEMELEITKNFNAIYNNLVGSGQIKPTAFSKYLGYSSTAQLNATLAGEALISTKAIICLVKNLNINPVFLFTGRGDILMTEATELENVKKENSLWSKRYDDAQQMINNLNATIKNLQKQNTQLLEITWAAIEHYKEHPEVAKEHVELKEEEEEE